MGGASVQDWVFWTSGAVMALGGVVLVLWALFWDRARGRKRCPRCWYSMEGVPPAGLEGESAWVCPECGKEVRGARKLARTRRRRGWAGAGALLLIGAYLSATAPEWARGDWTGLVPTSVLVLIATAEDPQLEGLKRQAQAPSGGALAAGQIQNATSNWIAPGLGAPGLTPPTPPTLSSAELLEGAAWSRLNAGRMWHWQSQVFVGRYLQGAGLSLLDEVTVPARWLAGEPVPVALDSSFVEPKARAALRGDVAVVGAGGPLVPRRAGMLRAPARGAAALRVPLELRANNRPVYFRAYKVPIVLCDRVQNLIEPVDSDDATLRVRGALDLGVRTDAGAEIVGDDRVIPDRWMGVDLGVAFRIEVFFEGRRVGIAEGRVPWDYASLKSWTDRVRADWSSGAQERVIRTPKDAHLVVTGDLQGAWEMYRAWPFDKVRAAAWTGRYEIPVRVDYVRDSQNQR